MKMWCSLNRNPVNKCRESCALWSSFPGAQNRRNIFGETPGIFNDPFEQDKPTNTLIETLPKSRDGSRWIAGIENSPDCTSICG
jgi:hypothetical protein